MARTEDRLAGLSVVNMQLARIAIMPASPPGKALVSHQWGKRAMQPDTIKQPIFIRTRQRVPSASTRCTDGGRAINVGEAIWPETRTGDAADLYRTMRDALESEGFRLTARILEYAGGNLGNAGLFLSWPQGA